MVSLSDDELEYLSPSFNPSSLTVPRLRNILTTYEISYPSSAKKSDLIDIFNQEVVPRSRKILAARSRIKRSSRGITDMPSSQEGTINGDGDDDSTSMPPPAVPPSRSKSRKSDRTENNLTVGEDEVARPSRNGASSGGKLRPNKHARPSDTETDLETPRRSPIRKTRRSEALPIIESRPSEDSSVRPPLGESVFSHENPFQSGSSPLVRTESRRRSAGVSNERRKSSSARRRTEGAARAGTTRIKQEDGIVVPSVEIFDIPLNRVSKPNFKAKEEEEVEGEEDGLVAGEEFTPQERLELVKERAANGGRDILPPRKTNRTRKSSAVPTSAPWVIMLTLFMGYALWWRQDKLQAGYCGIGRSSDALSNVQIPEWATILLPQCEPCPQHAICYENLQTACEQDFVLKPHPLSLGGLVPLPPTCEPDGEKARRVKAVADRAIENLRERRANWECGTLVDEQGKSAPAVELDDASLKKEVATKRRRGMSDREFEDLWKSALGELVGRDEVVYSRNE